MGRNERSKQPNIWWQRFWTNSHHTLQSCDFTETVLCCCFFLLFVCIPTCFTSVNFFFFFFFHPDPSSHPCQSVPHHGQQRSSKTEKRQSKETYTDSHLSGSEYDYRDEDVQSTTAIAVSQEAFREQHNTTVAPQPPSGEVKAKEGFALIEAMKSMWSISMLEREDRQKEREYQDRKEMLERENRQKE